ncbi:DUF2693 domain-containing protein [Marivirga lumbricoides]|uniref:DUF2693 domain-containing protein n=1 Tax=Marivirga lumbricoides TaxID=1046115 RepID=A0A2T4DR76_9BACT|nr:DUF2693 domain-containing protein [Marivirga lumbricoides]
MEELNNNIPAEKKNFRSFVFKRAHEIRKSTGKAMAVCLAKAWQLYRLAKSMAKGAVNFAYEKKDGSLRKATGTLKDVHTMVKGTSNNSSSPKVLHYFDIDAQGFRCFKVENFITIY